MEEAKMVAILAARIANLEIEKARLIAQLQLQEEAKTYGNTEEPKQSTN